MRVIGKFLPLALALLLSACAGKSWQPPLTGEENLFRLDGSSVSPAEFQTLAAGADYIFVGEQHNRVCHHQAQALLLERVLAAGLRPALALEMLPAEDWDKLMLFDGVPENLAKEKDNPEAAPKKRPPLTAFPAITRWMEIWGYNFNIYEPVLAPAYEAGLPIRGVNLPRRIIAAVSKGGLDGVPEGDLSLMPPEVLPLPAAQAEALAPMRTMHAARPNRQGNSAAAHFEEVMRLWDSGMGWNVSRLHFATGRPVFMILGIGHMENGWGLPRTVGYFDPGAKMLTIAPWSQSGLPPVGFADLFYYCAPEAVPATPVKENNS